MMAMVARLGATVRRVAGSLGDRFSGGLVLGRREKIAWGLLIAAALLLRLWNLGAMVPHHDESIHAHFAYSLLTQGEYQYDPTYHGPLLFYLTAGLFALFGVFAKFPSAVIGTDDPIVLPRASARVDYEADLAVVVGRRLKQASPQTALAGVVGYTNANDVSERDFQKLDGQWVRSKSCDTFAPMGPALVTADEVPEPGALRVVFGLNDATLQDSATYQLVFDDVPHLLAFISEPATLEPGDVVLTGTPPGVGFARRPSVYLKAGDVAEVEIGNLPTKATDAGLNRHSRLMHSR